MKTLYYRACIELVRSDFAASDILRARQTDRKPLVLRDRWKEPIKVILPGTRQSSMIARDLTVQLKVIGYALGM